MCAQPNEVRRDTLKFAHQHSDGLRAFRDLQLQKLLNGHHVSKVVTERIEVVHPIGDYDSLLILLIFKELLHARVEIANVRRGLDHHFAIEHQLEAQHTVCRRVLRTHRDSHLRVQRTVDYLKLRRHVYGRTHFELVNRKS